MTLCYCPIKKPIYNHDKLEGLLDDDHTQYALLAGRTGGQLLYGGTDANDNFTIDSTSNATKGKIILNSETNVDVLNEKTTNLGITIENILLKDSSISMLNYLSFNTSYTITESEATGTRYWDSDNDTTSLVLNNGVILQDGQELIPLFKNQTGDTILNGTPVMFAGSVGVSGRIRIQKAIADGSIPSKYFVGLATQDIANGEDGHVAIFGAVRGIDTTGTPFGETWSAGQEVFVSPTTPGAITNVMPNAPICAISIGIVQISHVNQGQIGVRSNFPISMKELCDVNGTPLTSDGQFPLWDNTNSYFDFDYNYLDEPTLEFTGFDKPENVVITGDSTSRTVTLTGSDWVSYYRKRPNATIISGWTSPAHSATTTSSYFLVFDGTTISWIDVTALPTNLYSYLLIAFTYYNTNDSNWVYQRECHGMMPWLTHRENHAVIGTYKTSGGTIGDYVLSSSTVADRRPSVSAATLYDEDLQSTNASLASEGNYTNYYLDGVGGTANFITTATDIVPLLGNIPYFNEFTGGSWQQTAMSNNRYSSIWLVAIPTTADTNSQKLRYIWVQGQSESAALLTQQSLTPNDVNLGTLTDLTPESVFIGKVIINYLGGNWTIEVVESIDGTRFSQTSSPQGNYLSSVNADLTLTGLGTSDSALGLNLSNANTWIGQQIFNSIPLCSVTPTESNHITNKEYVDSVAQGLDWKDSVLDELNFVTSEPSTPSTGDRYINTTTGNGSQTAQAVTANYIYEWNGTTWTEIIPNEGSAVWVEDIDYVKVFNGSAWVRFGSTVTHNYLSGLQGGTANEYYHLTNSQHTDLTDSGDSSLHYHSTDRARGNHTGTQTASTISDFDIEVSNNTDVAANTSARHTHSNKAYLDVINQDLATDDDVDFNSVTSVQSFATKAGNAGSVALHYKLQSTTGSNRLAWGLSNSETGGNVGSDLALFSYNDGGGYLGTPLYLQRHSGNFGVGNTNPLHRLVVKGDGSENTGLVVEGAGTYGFAWDNITASPYDYLKLRSILKGTATTNIDNILIADRTGQVGIGKIPTSKLDVNGSVLATTFTDGTASLSSGSLSNVKLGSLTTNGFIKTSGGDGALSVDTSTYLTAIPDPLTIGQLNVDNLTLDGNTLSSTDSNGNIILDPNGTGLVNVSSDLSVGTNGTSDAFIRVGTDANFGIGYNYIDANNYEVYLKVNDASGRIIKFTNSSNDDLLVTQGDSGNTKIYGIRTDQAMTDSSTGTTITLTGNVVKLTATSNRTVTTITGGQEGDRIIIINLDSSSTATFDETANLNLQAATRTLQQNDIIEFTFFGTINKWLETNYQITA